MAKQKEHGISWCQETWNPIRGCTRVSQGCVNCYAERLSHRFNKPGLAYEGLTDQHGRWNGVIRVAEDRMLDPLHWKRPRRVFVNSMSDLFHENVSDETIDRIFAVMALCPQHSFQVLTKRPARMLDYCASDDTRRRVGSAQFDVTDGVVKPNRPVSLTLAHRPDSTEDKPRLWSVWPLPNVWLGVSVEDQKTADERIPLLLQTPAAVRWISAEPLLGPVDLRKYLWYTCSICGESVTVHKSFVTPVCPTHGDVKARRMLDWVVVGGESGRGARPMEEAWARSLRDQCVAAGVAFHFKQWGEYLPAGCDGAPGDGQVLNASNSPVRIGKHKAGRELDGRTWDEYPEAKEPIHG